MEDEPKTRQSVVGTTFLNIAEFVSPGKSMEETTKIPFSCCVGGATTSCLREATLVVNLNFINIQNDQDPLEPVQIFFSTPIMHKTFCVRKGYSQGF